MHRYHQPVELMSSVDEPLLVELSDDGQSINSPFEQVTSTVSKDSPVPPVQLLSSWKPYEYAVYHYSPNQLVSLESGIVLAVSSHLPVLQRICRQAEQHRYCRSRFQVRATWRCKEIRICVREVRLGLERVCESGERGRGGSFFKAQVLVLERVCESGERGRGGSFFKAQVLVLERVCESGERGRGGSFYKAQVLVLRMHNSVQCSKNVLCVVYNHLCI